MLLILLLWNSDKLKKVAQGSLVCPISNSGFDPYPAPQTWGSPTLSGVFLVEEGWSEDGVSGVHGSTIASELQPHPFDPIIQVVLVLICLEYPQLPSAFILLDCFIPLYETRKWHFKAQKWLESNSSDLGPLGI